MSTATLSLHEVSLQSEHFEMSVAVIPYRCLRIIGLTRPVPTSATAAPAPNPPFTSRQLILRYTPAHGAASSEAGTRIGMGRAAGRAVDARLRLLHHR